MSVRLPHLLVNDDGLHAPGLEALRRCVARLGPSLRVAPDRNCSGASQSTTLDRPVGVRRVEADAWAVAGTPADCVHAALAGGLGTALAEQLGGPPRCVFSGINHGENLGDDLLYSGTVGAAQVAALFGVPALAISAVWRSGQPAPDIDGGMALVVALVEQGLLDQGPLWNINLPAGAPRGVKLTHMGRRAPAESVSPAHAPRGPAGLWIGLFHPGLPEAGTDFEAIEQGLVSITPLTLDRTDQRLLAASQAWFESTRT